MPLAPKTPVRANVTSQLQVKRRPTVKSTFHGNSVLVDFHTLTISQLNSLLCRSTTHTGRVLDRKAVLRRAIRSAVCVNSSGYPHPYVEDQIPSLLHNSVYRTPPTIYLNNCQPNPVEGFFGLLPFIVNPASSAHNTMLISMTSISVSSESVAKVESLAASCGSDLNRPTTFHHLMEAPDLHRESLMSFTSATKGTSGWIGSAEVHTDHLRFDSQLLVPNNDQEAASMNHGMNRAFGENPVHSHALLTTNFTHRIYASPRRT